MKMRKWNAPEVLQRSSMDCGPAALGCILSGFGIAFDALQLRAACQTQADGTSIDRLEEVAGELGLEVEQVVVPNDHLLFDSSPLLVTLDLPEGGTHFAVVWRRIGQRVQLMDPARGRSWMRREALLRQLHRVELPVAADAFRSYAGSAAFIEPLRARLLEHTSRSRVARLLDDALRDPTYRALSLLDAATRAVSDLGRRGVLRTRRERHALLTHWLRGEQSPAVPDACFPALPLTAASGMEQPSLSLRGTPALRVVRARVAPRSVRGSVAPSQLKRESGISDLVTVQAKEARWPLPICIALIALFTFGALQETVLLRSWIELDQSLSDVLQRSGAALCVLAWIAVMACFELLLAIGSLRIGRELETQLRVSFMNKLPRLHDQYFLSRPVSDLADRGHMVHLVRGLPPFALALLRACFELIGTGCGMVWLDATSLWRVSLVSVLSLWLPLVALRTLTERDRGVRALVSDLGRTYFDVLRGISAVRAHHAEENLEREHTRQLTQLARSGRGLARAGVLLEGVVSAVSVAMSGWLFLGYLEAGHEPLAGLLYLYWALSLPAHGRTIAALSRQLPGYINVLARIREPLTAREIHAPPSAADAGSGAAGLAFEAVELRAGPHVILSDLSLQVAPGEHVAIVGASGAGKSSILGLLLGWHEPSAGRVCVDGRGLEESDRPRLRSQTVWLDPAVQLWNRSLYDNVRYGKESSPSELPHHLERAELYGVLEELPSGLRSELGEAGCRISGGEGQRVRFARVLAQAAPRLVLLDEPFRGLEQEQRQRLLRQARAHWAGATLLCVTHDVAETLAFARVLVVDGGRIVEDGPPEVLLAADSHYAELVRAERTLLASLRGDRFRQIRLERGRMVVARAAAAPEADDPSSLLEAAQ